jgi:hypothetical protein
MTRCYNWSVYIKIPNFNFSSIEYDFINYFKQLEDWCCENASLTSNGHRGFVYIGGFNKSKQLVKNKYFYVDTKYIRFDFAKKADAVLFTLTWS